MGAETPTSARVAVPPKLVKKDPKNDPAFQKQYIWATAALSGVLLVAAAAIALFKRWRKRQEESTDSTFNQLTSYRSLYESGELSHEEYQRIRQRVVKKLNPELPKPDAAVTPPLPPPPPAAPPTDLEKDPPME
jgi:hypothetical protein